MENSESFSEELADIKKIPFKLDNSELWGDKAVYGLFKSIYMGQNGRFILRISDGDNVTDFVDDRDVTDPIQAKLISWEGKYTKIIMAYPVSTYARSWYDWWFEIVDTRKPQISSIELLPVEKATCRILSINNSNRDYSIIGVFHLGKQYSLQLRVNNPNYFTLCEKIKPGAKFTMTYVKMNGENVIVDAAERVVYETKPLHVLGFRQFTIDQRQFTIGQRQFTIGQRQFPLGAGLNSSLNSDLFEVVCERNGAPTKKRYFGPSCLKLRNGTQDKKYVFRASLSEYSGWDEIITMSNVIDDDITHDDIVPTQNTNNDNNANHDQI